MFRRKAGIHKKIFSRIQGVILSLIVCLGCFALPVYAQGFENSSYVVSVYNEQNGLPTGEANTILQTEDGHIWIGSYGGLIRYNGTDFRNYSVEGAISSSSIRSLYQDSKGRLWIGTNDAGVVVMENDVFTEIESPADMSFLCIRDFAEGQDGTIYVASNSGVASVVDGRIQPFEASELNGTTVYSLAVDGFDRLWSIMNGGDCLVIKDDKVVKTITPDMFFKGADFYSVDANEQGKIVLGSSDNQIAILETKTEGLEKKDLNTKVYNTGEIVTHNAVALYDSAVLVSGINGLAVLYMDGSVRVFGEEQKAMSVNAAICDYENNIWLASSSYGVTKYSQGCYLSPNYEADLHDVTINTVAYQDGYWYIGTDTGLIVCDENWNRVTNGLTDMFQGIRIRCIVADSKDGVWIASYSDNAVVCYRDSMENVECYNSGNGLNGDRARVLFELSDGSMAVGTQTGVNIIKNGRVTESYGKDEGVDNPTILCFGEGDDGTLYVGSDGNGIYMIKDGKVTNHGFNEGLEEGVVLRMLQNSDKSGWFISAGSSLYYWENNQFRKLTNFSKDAGSIFDFYDRNGKLWILQNSGMLAIDKTQLLSGEQTDTIHYGVNHGLSGSINANTWHYIDEAGNIYLSTRAGISVFGFKGVGNAAPKLCIAKAVVDGQVYEHPLELNLGSNTQRITIEYATLSYTDTMELRVSAMLKGFDKVVELKPDKSGSVSYTNLPGGEYVFEVTVYSPENPDIVQTCTLHITKEKKLTESPLFWIIAISLLVLASSGIVALAVRAKLKRMHKKQQEYRDIIEQALSTFAKMIDAKDAYTNGHSMRVAEYSRELAKRMGMTEEEQENIYYMALLHDIGKIGVPDYILNKPGKLTEKEMQIIRRHVVTGGEILKEFTALDGIAEGAKYHHERYDGKGYSEGLAGTDIPKVARIIGVADSYDAMSSDRCYRSALTPEKIESELKGHSGMQFDPEVVPHMLAMIEEGIVPFRQD